MTPGGGGGRGGGGRGGLLDAIKGTHVESVFDESWMCQTLFLDVGAVTLTNFIIVTPGGGRGGGRGGLLDAIKGTCIFLPSSVHRCV
jgi:hypothetical protein